MAITYTDDSATVSTSEYSFPADTTSAVPTAQTTQGIFQFFVYVASMAAADQFRFRLYEKAGSSATQQLVEEWIISNAQSKPTFVTPSFILGSGWDFTALKVAGTDRTVYWSIRKIS
jgi:hypothetical protein